MIGRLVRVFLAGMMVLAAAVPLSSAGAQETFERSSLTVETASGGRFRFNVELAESSAQQAQGLMFRESMAEDAGMLFVYNREQTAAFWMKNTLISLDMIFIEADGRILNIHAKAVPHSTDTIRSAGPVKGILEINGGMAARLGIRPGDRVIHPVFGNAK
ncbi:DUF192 domain-containing protein [Azospirillum sp. SYSU D00513]|uniref:DUF192 domain-containing protein n=1 Tax=Azospirillum sp. SYSU D00513 TaxID=2812561 RepID=UPI001A960272|nr:DUF192 domain-containing protein [Azospirillum sp. SYSU D00513]